MRQHLLVCLCAVILGFIDAAPMPSPMPSPMDSHHKDGLDPSQPWNLRKVRTAESSPGGPSGSYTSRAHRSNLMDNDVVVSAGFSTSRLPKAGRTSHRGEQAMSEVAHQLHPPFDPYLSHNPWTPQNDLDMSGFSGLNLDPQAYDTSNYSFGYNEQLPGYYDQSAPDPSQYYQQFPAAGLEEYGASMSQFHGQDGGSYTGMGVPLQQSLGHAVYGGHAAFDSSSSHHTPQEHQYEDGSLESLAFRRLSAATPSSHHHQGASGSRQGGHSSGNTSLSLSADGHVLDYNVSDFHRGPHETYMNETHTRQQTIASNRKSTSQRATQESRPSSKARAGGSKSSKDDFVWFSLDMKTREALEEIVSICRGLRYSYIEQKFRTGLTEELMEELLSDDAARIEDAVEIMYPHEAGALLPIWKANMSPEDSEMIVDRLSTISGQPKEVIRNYFLKRQYRSVDLYYLLHSDDSVLTAFAVENGFFQRSNLYDDNGKKKRYAESIPTTAWQFMLNTKESNQVLKLIEKKLPHHNRRWALYNLTHDRIWKGFGQHLLAASEAECDQMLQILDSPNV
ncbi:hypothetical protein CBS101457_000232 [Exobasidium rhododendri]|nr:hypothetical protein CBS101457_000232 [Exobasidium rhododendri]